MCTGTHPLHKNFHVLDIFFLLFFLNLSLRMIACLFLFSRKRSLVICTGSLIASRFKNPDETIDTCTFENLY